MWRKRRAREEDKVGLLGFCAIAALGPIFIVLGDGGLLRLLVVGKIFAE